MLVLRGKATAATIAVVAQIPAFATVALITQYAIFAWFVIGVAATSQLMAPARGRRRAGGTVGASLAPARRHRTDSSTDDGSDDMTHNTRPLRRRSAHPTL